MTAAPREPTDAEIEALAVLLHESSRLYWLSQPQPMDYGDFAELTERRQAEHRAMARTMWETLMGEALVIIGFLRQWMAGGYEALHTDQDEVDAMLHRADEFLAGEAS